MSYKYTYMLWEWMEVKKIKLFCIPHAGGSAVVYIRWKKYLDPSIDLIPVELSGRGRRIGERLYDSLKEAIDDVESFIESNIDEGEYMIYGHSMGCAIAYEVCCNLLEKGYKMPINLFLSGRECPFIKSKEEKVYNLSDEDFAKAIIEFGGTPKEIFENDELRKLFLPILRSDYRNTETFEPINKDTILPVNMTVLNGKDDLLTEEQMKGWEKLTSKEFRRYDFDGGHFFLHETPEKVVKIINESVWVYKRE